MVSFALLWLLFSPRSSGIRSSLPGCRDKPREEPRARCEFRKQPFAGRSRPCNDTDHIRRNTTLRLFPGISVTTGAKNPTDCALKATLRGLAGPGPGCDRGRLRSNAWLLGAVSNPSHMCGAVEIDRRPRRKYRGGPLIIPRVASHGEMWTIDADDPISRCDRPN
jgi:hypothetical protein